MKMGNGSLLKKCKGVIPAILVKDKKEFQRVFSRVARVADCIQVDIMDGKFVKERSVRFSELPNLSRHKKYFEAHLMVANPSRYFGVARQKGFFKVLFHIESFPNAQRAERAIERAHASDLLAFIALNPGTHVRAVRNLLGEVDGILVMGVHPGKTGQKFILSVKRKIEKLAEIREKYKMSFAIQVDGGVNLELAPQLRRLGVDYINSGSFVSESETPRKAFQQLARAFSSSKPKARVKNV
ncbi:hypothetical protein D6817_03745 [Candidatus Pacearchaeota archaeon]|nr:MAG: hypothetical protein D6817_03745 [Candidatus Pacearchaeota archaeon]